MKLLSENDPAVTAKGRTKCHFPPHDFYIDPVFDFTIWRDGVLYEVGDKFTAYSCAYCTDRPYGTATGKYPDSVRGAIMDAFEMWYNGDTPAEWFQEVER